VILTVQMLQAALLHDSGAFSVLLEFDSMLIDAPNQKRGFSKAQRTLKQIHKCLPLDLSPASSQELSRDVHTRELPAYLQVPQICEGQNILLKLSQNRFPVPLAGQPTC